MNQKEEIEKHEKNLKELRMKLVKAEQKFHSDYGKTKKKIAKLEAQYRSLFSERDKLALAVAGVLSDNPQKFKDGHSHELKQEILSNAESVGKDQWKYTRDAQSVIWDMYNQFINYSPEVEKIDKKLDAISRQEEMLKESKNGGSGHPNYSNACKQIAELEQDIRWEEQFIEKLKDMGWFRQFSKEQKEQNIKETRREEINKNMDKFKAWFDETYMPKMKEAVAFATSKKED